MSTPPPPRIPKWMLDAQVFLLRRKLMGPMNKQLMVITTKGRKSGKQFSVPIGFVRDGSDILTFNIGGNSNWYKNVLANGQATLEIQGKKLEGRPVPVSDAEGRRNVLEIYKREQPGMLERFFGAPATASLDERQKAADARGVVFLRFKV